MLKTVEIWSLDERQYVKRRANQVVINHDGHPGQAWIIDLPTGEAHLVDRDGSNYVYKAVA